MNTRTSTARLVLQVSADLIPVVGAGTPEGGPFHRAIAALRSSLQRELGVTFPAVKVAGNSLLPRGDYVIYLNDVAVTSGHVRSDAPQVLLLRLAQVLRRQVREFIGTPEVLEMIERIRHSEPSLVEQVTPKWISLQQLTEILQRLVEESVSIRDFKSILHALNQQASGGQDVPTLVEQVRTALKDDLCRQILAGRPVLRVHPLDPEIEDSIRNSVRQSVTGPYIAMGRETIEQIVEAAHSAIGSLPETAQRPVILAGSDIRRFVKRLLERRFPEIAVLSREQLSSKVDLQPCGVIALPAMNDVSGAA
jgi:type III secretory pathway component EscV